MPKKRGESSFDERALINDLLDTEEALMDRPVKPAKKRRRPKPSLDRILERPLPKQGQPSQIQPGPAVPETQMPTEPVQGEPKIPDISNPEPRSAKSDSGMPVPGIKGVSTPEPSISDKPNADTCVPVSASLVAEERDEADNLAQLKEVLDAARKRRLKKRRHSHMQDKPAEKSTPVDLQAESSKKSATELPSLYTEKELSEPGRQPVPGEMLRFGAEEDLAHRWELEKAFFNYPRVHKRRIIRLTLLTMLLAVLFFLLVWKAELLEPDKLPPAPVPQITTSEPEQQRIEYRVVYENVSFAEVLNGGSSGRITLLGFLKFELVEDGVVQRHVYSLVDDFNESVFLRGLTKQQERLFIRDSISVSLYRVHGSFSPATNFFQVYNITRAERPSYKEIV